MKQVKPSFSDILSNALTQPCYEPEKRIKDIYHRQRGTRHLPVMAIHHRHRYPIKDGIKLSVMLAENICANNSLLERLKGK